MENKVQQARDLLRRASELLADAGSAAENKLEAADGLNAEIRAILGVPEGECLFEHARALMVELRTLRGQKANIEAGLVEYTTRGIPPGLAVDDAVRWVFRLERGHQDRLVGLTAICGRRNDQTLLERVEELAGLDTDYKALWRLVTGEDPKHGNRADALVRLKHRLCDKHPQAVEVGLVPHIEDLRDTEHAANESNGALAKWLRRLVHVVRGGAAGMDKAQDIDTLLRRAESAADAAAAVVDPSVGLLTAVEAAQDKENPEVWDLIGEEPKGLMSYPSAIDRLVSLCQTTRAVERMYVMRLEDYRNTYKQFGAVLRLPKKPFIDAIPNWGWLRDWASRVQGMAFEAYLRQKHGHYLWVQDGKVRGHTDPSECPDVYAQDMTFHGDIDSAVGFLMYQEGVTVPDVWEWLNNNGAACPVWARLDDD